MIRKALKFTIAVLICLLPCAAGRAIPITFDASGSPDFKTSGKDILSLDYLRIVNNRVMPDGPDYPFGKIQAILYKPVRYENKHVLREPDWRPSDVIARYPIPGPSKDGRWANNDESTFRNMGLYRWSDGDIDQITFRIIVENPTKPWETETLDWGTIHENENFSGTVFKNDNAIAIFRTSNLPELELTSSVVINDIWFVHNVSHGDNQGLEVHVDFQVDNMRTQTCRLAAFVHTELDGAPVKCQIDDPEYKTSDGYLTSQNLFVPLYLTADYPDMALFIPYDAFPPSVDFRDIMPRPRSWIRPAWCLAR